MTKSNIGTCANKRVALYCRVSTDGQTVENQTRELTAVAKRHGWKIVETFTDQGISGAKGRNGRPGFDALHKAIARREIDLVATWSVDRLGRSLQEHRPVSPRTRDRHHDAGREDDFSDHGGVCRIRAVDDPRTHSRGAEARQGDWENPWKAQGADAQASRSDTDPTGRWFEFQKDCPTNPAVAWRCTAGTKSVESTWRG